MSIKAFELVPVLERDLLIGDRTWMTIDCIECCGKNLYVGTNDCFIYHFLLEEKVSSSGRLVFTPIKQLHMYLGLKKAVNELKAASALNRLLVLCDNTVTLLHMINLEPIPSGAKIKGVIEFAVNENPVTGDPFCVEVCTISLKRKTVQIYAVHEDRVQLMKEVSTPEQPVAIAVDGYFLCLAMSTQYIILCYNTGVSQDLFPFNSEEKQPIVKRIGREEFLLAGPGALVVVKSGAFAPLVVNLRLLQQLSDHVQIAGSDTDFPIIRTPLDSSVFQVNELVPLHFSPVNWVFDYQLQQLWPWASKIWVIGFSIFVWDVGKIRYENQITQKET